MITTPQGFSAFLDSVCPGKWTMIQRHGHPVVYVPTPENYRAVVEWLDTNTAPGEHPAEVFMESPAVPTPPGVGFPSTAAELPELPKPPPKGHPHAALMALYAADAAEHSKPWGLWEWRDDPKYAWGPCNDNPSWTPHYEYRRKPKTIRIGSVDVPEPLREMPGAQVLVYVATPLGPHCGCIQVTLDSAGFDFMQHALAYGFLHATRDAAERHSAAMIALSRTL